MDIVSYILSKSYVDKTLVGMGALKGSPAMISSIVDNPDGTHDITFSWKDNSDVTHTSILTVANGETPTITSTEIEGGHTITFATTDPSQSVSFNVMDGAEGQRGVSVIRADVDANNYLRLELSDGNVINAGQIKTVSMVDNTLSLESANPVENRVITSALNNKVNKVSGKQLSTEDFTTAEKNKLANIENGAQVNTLENLIINGEEATIVDKKIALNIITSAVSNLQNYYLKSETYTKTEVEELIGSTVGVTIEIVQELPTVGQTNVIYFLPTETTNVYSQYIYTANDGWVLIGSTSVDLSNYYTKGQVDTLLNGKQNVLTIDAFPTAMSNNPVASGGVYSAIAQMQPQFQFTNMPVASESNYGFVYQYVGNAGTYEPNMFYRCVYNTYAGEYRWEEVIFHATVVVDSELSSTSINPVQNKVVKEALDAKQDIMQFSTMPSAQDNLGKIVQYTGATTATYQNACFYKAVYDSEHDTYVWIMVKFSADISVDNVLSDVSENPVQNKVITQKFGEYKTAFTGTEEEWNALTSEQQNVYDIMNITNDGTVLNLGIYLEKKTAMPVASEDVVNRIYLYTGTTTQDYKKGVVYQCVSDGQTPTTYSWVALIDFGTAATKNSTDRVSPNNTALVESQSVYSAINTALSSIYSPRGEITCAELTSELLISDNIGNVYETSDSGTTTALFLQGAGHPIAVGSNVGVINAGQGRILFNLMANAFDLTDYQKKDLTSAVEGQTTVESALGALSTDKQPKDLTTTVESATTVEGALGALSDNKQAKTLTTSVESQTTVEGALGALSTNKATQAEVNDIVNVLGAKNILNNEVTTNNDWNGVSRTVNADGTITLNGTSTAWDFANFNYVQGQKSIPSGTYIINGGCENTALAIVADGSVIARQYGAGETTFTITDNMVETYARFEMSTDKTFTSESSIIKPMIRLASDPDNTYIPYVPTNAKLNEEKMSYVDNGVLGAKNLAKPINSISYLDITVVCDANGVLSITGTASGSGGRLNIVSDSFMLKAGTYKVVHTSNDLTKYSSMVCHKKSDNTSLGYSLIDNGTIDNSHAQFTLTSDTECFMGMNTYQGTNYGTSTGTKEYVMVVLADDTDNTYQPYAPTNRECVDYKTNGILGAHNLLLKMDLELIKAANSTTTWTNNVGVTRGITITVNDDGTFTVSGTATGRVAFTIVTSSKVDWLDGLYGKELILSGSIANTQLNIWDNTSSIYYAYTGNGEESDIFHIPENNHTIFTEFVIGNGNTVNGTIKPMVRLASDTDKTFQPYAMTNQQLTGDMVYSTNETKTGKIWINGKPIYRKVVDLGALPNTTTKTVNHGISNLDAIINWYGYAERPSDGGHFPLPYVFGGLVENNIGVFASPSVITVTTGTDRSAMTGTIIIEYTKTTV